MFKRNHTIQGRILRALGIVIVAVVILSGLSLFAIFKAEGSFQATNAELNKNRVHFMDLRLSLEHTSSAFELIGASKGESGLQHLESIRKAKATFLSVIDVMATENEAKPWAKEIAEIKGKFEAVDVVGREVALAFVEGKTEIANVKQEGLRNGLGELRTKLDELRTTIGNYHEVQLGKALQALILLIIPVAAATLILPTASMWFTTQKVDKELSNFVKSLSNFSEQNDQTSEGLRSASEALSAASSEQSAAVQETVASIAEIRSMLSQTANHVREVQSLTSVVNDKTHDGSQIMTRMEKSMLAIEQSNAQLQSFEEIIQSIRGKTQMINDIVFKTQLLSFNASIEAARAGQYGRGFAVVAEEVGKLAQMSGSASKEIDQLLNDSQKRVVQIVEAVQERVRDGKGVTADALKRFNEIAKQIVVISEKVNQVGEASVEQEGGVEQTARAMDQMDETAMENKKASEQILKISDRVRHLSGKIREVTEGVRRFVKHETSNAASIAPSSANGTTTDVESSGNEAVLSLVNRLSQRHQSSASQKLDAANGISADDGSFRKVDDRG